MYYPEEVATDTLGRWYYATVVLDRANVVGTLRHSNNDPWASTVEWNRYDVRWEQALPGEGEGDGVDCLSPWEMYAVDDEGRGCGGEGIPRGVAVRALECLEQLMDTDRCAIVPHLMSGRVLVTCTYVRLTSVVPWSLPLWHSSIHPSTPLFFPRYLFCVETPGPQYCLPDCSGRPVYYNQRVPLPIGLELLHQRVRAGFYRQEAALLADAELLVANAQTYAGDGPVVDAVRGM